ncbi:unnamed protein product [Pieris macdunnoughi]|uniref:Uncharacterized protein n=1 Tax=Pieris macdunnoughi TaxID=345717 RepID=A0A821L304_9NEOP|nr:unnamed protein product [Pieris macdunnoughi]
MLLALRDDPLKTRTLKHREWGTRAAQSICDEGRGVKGVRARVGRGFASRRVPQHVSIGSLRIHSPPIEARLHRDPYRPLNGMLPLPFIAIAIIQIDMFISLAVTLRNFLIVRLFCADLISFFFL